jgi:hypothetical protein
MLDTPGWHTLCALPQELRAWEREARIHNVGGWPCPDGTYDFGGIDKAERLLPGMIVSLGVNPHYDHWVSFPWTGETMRLHDTRYGFVYSCVFDERADAWDAVILCNMRGAPLDVTDPVWGVVRHRVARIDWYCQQFRGIEPRDRPNKAPGDITQGPLEDRLRSFLWYMQNIDYDTDSDVDSLAESVDGTEVYVGIAPSQAYLDALLPCSRHAPALS